METKTKNDLFNLIIYGVFISAIYMATLIASSYMGNVASFALIVGLGMIVYAVFNFKYLRLFKEDKK